MREVATETPPERRFAWLKDWGVLLISVLTLASTTFQFYVRDILKPTALEINAKLEQASSRDALTLVRITIRATNPTDRRVYVPAFWFNVYGVALGEKPCDAGTDWRAALEKDDEFVMTTYNGSTEVGLVAQRRMFANGSAWFEPKDVTNFEDVIAVPARHFDFLKLSVHYIQARSLDALNEPQPVIWREDQGEWFAVPSFRGAVPALEQKNDVAAEKAIERLGRRWQRKAGGGVNVAETVLALPRAPARPGASARVVDTAQSGSAVEPCS